MWLIDKKTEKSIIEERLKDRDELLETALNDNIEFGEKHIMNKKAN